MTTTVKTLADVKPGDEVAYVVWVNAHATKTRARRIEVVERVTDTEIMTKRNRYNRKHGRYTDYSGAGRIEPVTEEHRAEIAKLSEEQRQGEELAAIAAERELRWFADVSLRVRAAESSDEAAQIVAEACRRYESGGVPADFS